MNKIIPIILIISSLFISNFALADLNKSDKAFLAKTNKAGIKAKNKELILNINNKPNTSWVYVMQNTAAKAIYINHPPKYPGTASAGWMTVLDSKQWSALLLTRPNFNLTCHYDFANKPTSTVACQKVLKISRFKPHTITAAKGDYWLSENQNLNRMMKTLSIRGISWQ